MAFTSSDLERFPPDFDQHIWWDSKNGGFPKNQFPWEPKTFIFRGYNPYIGGLKPSFFMVLGSKGRVFILKRSNPWGVFWGVPAF